MNPLSNLTGKKFKELTTSEFILNNDVNNSGVSNDIFSFGIFGIGKDAF